MGLERAVRVHRHVVGPLEDDVRLGEAFAASPRFPPGPGRAGEGPATLPFVGHVLAGGALGLRVDERRVGLHRRAQLVHEGLLLVGHLHETRRVLRDLGRDRGDRRHVLAGETDRLRVGGPDGLHARQRLGPRGVDRDDLAGGDLRPDHAAVEHPRQLDVVGVARPTRHLERRLDTRPPLAHLREARQVVEVPRLEVPFRDLDLPDLRRLRQAGLDRELDRGFLGLLLLRHGYPLFGAVRAAFWTASKIRPYVPQRQRLPARPCLISSSDGFGFLARNAVPATTKPGVQKPHCMASASTKACCSGESDSGVPSPSTVVISWPSASAASIRQDLTGSPSSSTVQRAAGAAITDLLRAGEVEVIAQRREQRHPRLDGHLPQRAVHLQVQRDGVGPQDRGFRRAPRADAHDRRGGGAHAGRLQEGPP